MLTYSSLLEESLLSTSKLNMSDTTWDMSGDSVSFLTYNAKLLDEGEIDQLLSSLELYLHLAVVYESVHPSYLSKNN